MIITANAHPNDKKLNVRLVKTNGSFFLYTRGNMMKEKKFNRIVEVKRIITAISHLDNSESTFGNNPTLVVPIEFV